MNNKNALVTVSMLSAYMVEDKKDYVDLIAQFVLNHLPKTVGQQVNEEDILDLPRL